MRESLAWGILSTGRMAAKFAAAIRESKTGELVAVGSRSQASADAFLPDQEIANRAGSYDAVLSDPAVAAVYIATPHPMHAEWAIRAAAAGKHVLCEKPLAMNHAQAESVVAAAREADVFLMEAFMYRCHPQTARILELLREGAIGELRVIQAAFSFKGPYDLSSRLLNRRLGGGGILDVGCYPVSIARLLAGAAAGQPFAEPLELRGCAHIGPESGVDEYAIADMSFPGGILAQLACGVTVSMQNSVRLYGTEGRLDIPDPWQPGRGGSAIRLILERAGATQPEEIAIEADRGFWAIEADTVTAHIEEREAPSPAMTWDDSLGNMRALDMWRAAIGLVYDEDGAQRPSGA